LIQVLQLTKIAMAYLKILSGAANTTSTFDLKSGDTTIGRHPDCTIVVEAGAVSRFHAKVTSADGKFELTDSGSRNGTFLNGQQIAVPTALKDGDRIRISEVEFSFVDEEKSGFAGSEMTFEGANFGIMMVDDREPSSQPFAAGSPMVEIRNSVDGFAMSATPEAKLEALQQIISSLGDAMVVDEVLPKILTSLFRLFPAADRGFIVMKDDEGNLIPRWVKTRGKQDETETIRISKTIVRRVMESREAILSMDASDDSRFDSSQSIADFSIRSMICAPLLDSEGEAFGVLQIDSTQGRGQFRDDDTDLLAGVAAYSGILINNAKMHERAMRQKEVEQDLQLATGVQQAFLPDQPPNAPGFRVSSYYQAAHHIGGDYYDYIHLPGGRVAIVVADVVGHGVAAAMFMAKLSAETRFCLASDSDFAAAIERLNDRMSALGVDRFVTFLVLVLDPSSDQVTIVNAGHMPPLVRDAVTREVSEPGEEESGLPIAISEGMEYEAVSFTMKPGDMAAMYTDGINEAMDINDEEFGIQKIRELIQAGGDSEQVIGEIIASVKEHVGEADPFDDMCLVIIERYQQEEELSTEQQIAKLKSASVDIPTSDVKSS
jgi:sigma-B regulation protein RsbU (phosphoserine phosphatase)